MRTIKLSLVMGVFLVTVGIGFPANGDGNGGGGNGGDPPAWADETKPELFDPFKNLDQQNQFNKEMMLLMEDISRMFEEAGGDSVYEDKEKGAAYALKVAAVINEFRERWGLILGISPGAVPFPAIGESAPPTPPPQNNDFGN